MMMMMMMMMMMTEVPNHIGPFGILKISWNVSVYKLASTAGGLVPGPKAYPYSPGYPAYTGWKLNKTSRKQRFCREGFWIFSDKILSMRRYDTYDNIW